MFRYTNTYPGVTIAPSIQDSDKLDRCVAQECYALPSSPGVQWAVPPRSVWVHSVMFAQ